MKFEVYQIDAWREPEGGWTYNDSFYICDIEIKGEPTAKKLTKALRNKELLPDPLKLRLHVDDYYSYEGVWCVQKESNGMPLYDLKEIKDAEV